MNPEEYKSFYHVDISTQINNKWKEDTVLGIVKDSRKYFIKIRGKDKELIKNRFISKEESRAGKRHNQKVIAIIYSYLLYTAINEFKEAKKLLLCRDVRPERFIIHYFQRICNLFNNQEVKNRIIRFRKRVEFDTREKLPKSLAGKYVRKVYQGKLKADKIFTSEEIDKLLLTIGKLL